MSHFTVLVPAGSEEELEKQLMPFHEYECTGIEEYLEFVPEDMNCLQAAYEKHGEGQDFDAFVADWTGGSQKNEEGIFGRMTNPNAKWDWWQVGGRWAGSLVTNSQGRVDTTLAKDIDWSEMLETRQSERASSWDNWAGFLKRAEIEVSDWFKKSDEEKRKSWKAIQRELSEDQTDDFFEASLFEPEGKTRKEHSALKRAHTFAFIDLDGKWHERGRMGWWACVSNKQPGYDKEFWKFIESLPQDQRIYIVDCHI